MNGCMAGDSTGEEVKQITWYKVDRMMDELNFNS